MTQAQYGAFHYGAVPVWRISVWRIPVCRSSGVALFLCVGVSPSCKLSVLFVCDTDLTMWKCCMFDIILENNINKTGKTILGGVVVKHGHVSCDIVHDCHGLYFTP